MAEIHRSGMIDLVAKSYQNDDEAAIITKCLSQLDNFKIDHSKQMINLSQFIGAIPLLIASCYKNNQVLRDETLYNRHHINAINLKTLQKLLENNISPYKIAMRGSSVTVKLNGSKLTQAMEQIENKKTKIEISKRLEVSRQTLSNYQSGQSLPSEETFQRILKFFKEMSNKITKDDLIDPINLLDPQNIFNDLDSSEKIEDSKLSGFRSEVNEKLNELQFSNRWFQKLPWDGVSIKKDINTKKLIFFTGLGEKDQLETLLSRINSTENVIKLFNNESIWIIQNENIISELEDSLSNKSSKTEITSLNDLPDFIKGKKISSI